MMYRQQNTQTEAQRTEVDRIQTRNGQHIDIQQVAGTKQYVVNANHREYSFISFEDAKRFVSQVLKLDY